MGIEVNDSGEFEDEVGRLYVRCNADPSSPFFIDVTTDYVEAVWRRARYSAVAGAECNTVIELTQEHHIA